MLCTQKHGRSPVAQEPSLFPLYGRTSLNASLPRYEFPECVMLPQTAYNMIHDELMLDGNPNSTWRPLSQPGWKTRPGNSWRIPSIRI